MTHPLAVSAPICTQCPAWCDRSWCIAAGVIDVWCCRRWGMFSSPPDAWPGSFCKLNEEKEQKKEIRVTSTPTQKEAPADAASSISRSHVATVFTASTCYRLWLLWGMQPVLRGSRCSCLSGFTGHSHVCRHSVTVVASMKYPPQILHVICGLIVFNLTRRSIFLSFMQQQL